MNTKNTIISSPVKTSIIILACIMAIALSSPTEVDAAAKKFKAVTNVKTKTMTSDSIKLSWKKSKKVKGYQIYRAVKKNGKYKKVKTIKKGSTKTWTNSNLEMGKTYWYKVRAYKVKKGKKIYGKFSRKVSGRTITIGDGEKIDISIKYYDGYSSTTSYMEIKYDDDYYLKLMKSKYLVTGNYSDRNTWLPMVVGKDYKIKSRRDKCTFTIEGMGIFTGTRVVADYGDAYKFVQNEVRSYTSGCTTAIDKLNKMEKYAASKFMTAQGVEGGSTSGVVMCAAAYTGDKAYYGGDCWGTASLTKILCDAIGLENRIVSAPNPISWSHMANEINLDGTWMEYDLYLALPHISPCLCN